MRAGLSGGAAGQAATTIVLCTRRRCIIRGSVRRSPVGLWHAGSAGSSRRPLFTLCATADRAQACSGEGAGGDQGVVCCELPRQRYALVVVVPAAVEAVVVVVGQVAVTMVLRAAAVG